MKRFLLSAAAVLFAGTALPAQDFDKAWSATEYASKYGSDLYYPAHHPQERRAKEIPISKGIYNYERI